MEKILSNRTNQVDVLPEVVFEYGLSYWVKDCQEAGKILWQSAYSKILEKACLK